MRRIASFLRWPMALYLAALLLAACGGSSTGGGADAATGASAASAKAQAPVATASGDDANTADKAEVRYAP